MEYNCKRYCKLEKTYCDLATTLGYCMVTACINRDIIYAYVVDETKEKWGKGKNNIYE